MRAKDGSLTWKMARVAGRQHGNVTRAQLLDLGMGSAAIGRRVASGVLHREYRTVYRVGHRAPSVQAKYAAAVLACGEGSVLGGLAAAYLYGLWRGRPPTPEVIVAGNRTVRGVVVHRARELDRNDVRMWSGIPVVSVPRLMVDLAEVLTLDALARVHHEARIRFAVSPQAVEAVLARRPTTKNCAGLRAVVRGDTPVILSRLERGFRRLVREHGFPLPVTNRKVGAHFVDCRWPEHRLTVELDSFRFHNSRVVWEQDRQRERDARARGDRFRRFTWRDVFEQQSYLLTQLDRLIPRK